MNKGQMVIEGLIRGMMSKSCEVRLPKLYFMNPQRVRLLFFIFKGVCPKMSTWANNSDKHTTGFGLALILLMNVPSI